MNSFSNINMKPNKKLAFCITCMNRLYHLQETLEKNILDNYLPEDVEFILLDYNSTDGLEEWVRQNMQSYIDTGILVYYKTIEPEHYHRSHSRNMSFRLSNAEILCNLDADNFLGEGFASFIINEFENNDNIFYTSNISFGDIVGRVAVRKEDFLKIKGYNEALQGYGCEDTDLIARLTQSGLTQKRFDNPAFYHCIQHSNEERVKEEFMAKNTERVYISYINPYCSCVLLLFKDFTCRHYTIVDSPHLFYLLPDSFPKDYIASTEGISLKEDCQQGAWETNDNQILITENGDTVTFQSDSQKIQYQNRDYYPVEDEELRTDLFFVLTLAANRFMGTHQMQSCEAVNPSGFGIGTVFKNFDNQTKILLQ